MNYQHILLIIAICRHGGATKLKRDAIFQPSSHFYGGHASHWRPNSIQQFHGRPVSTGFSTYKQEHPLASFQSYNSIAPDTNSIHGITYSLRPNNPFKEYTVKHVNHDVSSCPGHLKCIPLVQCAPFFESIVHQPHSKCSLYGKEFGVCCPDMQRPHSAPNRLPTFQGYAQPPPISLRDINYAAEEALEEFKKRETFETFLQENNVTLKDKSSPAFRHLLLFKTSKSAMDTGAKALKTGLTSQFIAKRFKLTPYQAAFGLQAFSAENTILANTCSTPTRCTKKNYFYRTPSGSCNNLKNPDFGAARTAVTRLLPPQYEDGILEPRMRTITGEQLPSARIVSICHVTDENRPSPKFSVYMMQWGQFIDHDVIQSPFRRLNAETGIRCCDTEGQFVASSFKHSACFPIDIPEDDPFFKEFGNRCMNFVRTQFAPRPNCTFGYEEQMNQLTHFIDGSVVYGSDEERETAVRFFQSGLLKTQTNDLLPPDFNTSRADCGLENTGLSCFLAGDDRESQLPDLTSFHVIWLRQHNKIARKLAYVNPQWNDEILFQETKRIIVGQMQHIIYNEWLPMVIGTDYSLKNGLLPLREGFSYLYDPNENPNIMNEFATVAFRFGHSLVTGMRDLFDAHHKRTETILTHRAFDNARLIYVPGKVEEYLRGMAKQPMQSFDNFFTESVTNRLFQGTERNFGMDLVALNTQRGRDHGIAPYNQLRTLCGLPRVARFEELSDVFSKRTIRKFKLLYSTPDDIDPFIGGISEAPVPGGIVGPTFRCIIAEQFQRLRRGDRFFYDNGGMKSSFSKAQVQEIRKTSWARIVCDNGRNIKYMQPLAMRLPGPLNEKIPCSSRKIPTLDLHPWSR